MIPLRREEKRGSDRKSAQAASVLRDVNRRSRARTASRKEANALFGISERGVGRRQIHCRDALSLGRPLLQDVRAPLPIPLHTVAA